MKRQKHATQMKEQIRNTEVQINEEEGNRQTTWKRIQITDSKPWKQNEEKFKNQLTRT